MTTPARNNTALIVAVLVLVALPVLAIAVVFGAGVLGAVFFVASNPMPPPPPPPIAVPALTPMQVAPPTAAPAVPAAPTKITTIPPDADVFRDGILMCATPCEMTAAEGEQLTLTIRKAGYQDHTMTVTAGSTSGVKLIKTVRP